MLRATFLKRVNASVGLFAALTCSAGIASAQAPRDSARGGAHDWDLVLVTSERVDALRLQQLFDGVSAGPSLMLRSASSLTARVPGIPRGVTLRPIAPQFFVASNSELPFSQNDGALWAGKGVSTRVLFGARLEGRRFQLIVAPELLSMQNRDWPLRRFPYNQEFNTPAVPPELSGGGYVFPFYYATFPIDQPMRFGGSIPAQLPISSCCCQPTLRLLQAILNRSGTSI